MSDIVEPIAIERLARIEVKLDQALDQHRDHEARIRRLERALWIATGAGLLGGGGIAAIVTQVMGG